ncbi:MAG TPA: lipopolysaccharide heptosyltransferase I [Terracidiphilus sp.]|nr:lipopolysaccharide heptosyltransferase I [Terracidiphilus sp.]
MQTQSKYRVLVVRLGAMGDILHALPAVTALRKMHPGWVIDWVVEPKWRSLLRADGALGRDTSAARPTQPVVDGLHFAATKAWRKTPFGEQTRDEVKALRAALRAAQYDTVIDLQGAVRSAALARLTGCRRRIGEAEPRERAARLLFTERVKTTGAHVIEQDLELAAQIAGDDLKYTQAWLPFDAEAETWADALLASSAARPAVLINPGAGWGAKRWPVERYGAVAQGLAERGCRVLVNAGPGEEPLAESIVQATGCAATVLNASLERLIAVTRRIALLVAGDTGPLHLACALGKPVVGIYGPTDPSRNGPFGTRAIVLRNPESKRDHTRRAEPEAGLLTIEPEVVLHAADQLLYSETTQ